MADELQAGPSTPLTDGATIDLRPQWNVDGKSIVFERHAGARSLLFLLRLAGPHAGMVEELECCNRGARRVQGRAAFFGLDVFAYVSDRGGTPAIWHADLGSREVEPLTQPMQDEADFGPTTTPDANGAFVFFRIVGHGRPHLFRGHLGESVQPLTIARREGDQPWFVRGADRLVFHSRRDGDDAVFVRSAEHGADAKRLSTGDEHTSFVTPFPAPSGSHVVFANGGSGISQLWAMRVDGSARQQLTFDAAPACFPAWSPDGTRIAYVLGDPNASPPSGRLMVMRIGAA
jgi:Tol biopolymer transport system component